MTTGVAGCNRLLIAEFLSTFAADLEPTDTGAGPLPVEAAECTPAAPANGAEPVGAPAAEAAGVVPGKVAAVAIVMGAVAVVPLLLDWVVDVELVVDPDATVSVTGTEIFPPVLTETVTVPV